LNENLDCQIALATPCYVLLMSVRPSDCLDENICPNTLYQESYTTCTHAHINTTFEMRLCLMTIAAGQSGHSFFKF